MKNISFFYVLYNCETRIIQYVITWDRLVMKFHSQYAKEPNLSPVIEAYIHLGVKTKRLRVPLWTTTGAKIRRKRTRRG